MKQARVALIALKIFRHFLNLIFFCNECFTRVRIFCDCSTTVFQLCCSINRCFWTYNEYAGPTPYMKQKCLGKIDFLNTSVIDLSKLIELVNRLLVHIAQLAISEGSDETAHMHSLVRAFAARAK